MIDPHSIRRRPDGSIDVDHYAGIACDLRAQDQCAALGRLAPPLVRVLRSLVARPSARIRALFGS